MKKILLATGLLVLLTQAGDGQRPLHTSPRLPSQEALNRLALTLGWTARVPMQGLRDGISTLQLLPHKGGHDILVQTRTGLVQLMDAETGDLKWRSRVGLPYRDQQPAAANEQSVFVNRHNRLFVLDRKTGRHRVWEIVQDADDIKLGYQLVYPPSTAMIADSAALFVPTGVRITAYLMPAFTEEQVTLPSFNPELGLPAGENPRPSVQPEFLWNVRFEDVNFSTPPVLTAEEVAVLADEGALISLNKFKGGTRFRYKFFGEATAPMGQHGRTVYAGTTGKLLYAINVRTEDLEWRHGTGEAVTRPVFATDKDVFVTAGRLGLARVDRATGERVWRNGDADMFLAVNKDFVYARDVRGDFLVLDYLKGRTLSRFDTRDFTVNLSQVDTDRVYLGAHDGQIICLHSRANATPFRPRTPPADEVPDKKGEPIPPPPLP